MRRILRIATSGAGVVGLAVAGTALATPANAADNISATPASPQVLSDCSGTNKFCFWKDGNNGGTEWETTSSWANLPYNFGASSWKNTRSDVSMCVYEIIPLTQQFKLLQKVPPATNVTVIPAGTNDLASRVETC
ncbi:exported hypothetical protein [Frankia canadensis]|uniref:Peptidase inhibitor family I36 n=1 Tax=Frankia canadensis TaxID=1836972 RepID=A0A2I2KNQ7_9ACTN|nr:hypothetical protein [Frankia canadensis]SNQ47290.1 exported hypothetical protein [Frankia canadensis]SOU54580.1 exported hypothetical protein [Frankia canadensis]